MDHSSDSKRAPELVFAEPTPLGLLGLALGCAALTPIAFGASLTPEGLRTAAAFCLLFGAGCQFLAGIMNFANKNLFGGTLFLAFSFNWMLNYMVLSGLAEGRAPDHGVLLAADACALVIFVVFTYGFGFFSKLLFLFLLDIDLLYLGKVINGATGTAALNLPIAVFTVALGVLSLYIAFAMLINPVANRRVFPVPGPAYRPAPATGFDASVRRTVLEILYRHFREHAFQEMPRDDFLRESRARLGEINVQPDVFYLAERRLVSITPAESPAWLKSLRLTAEGVDLYERTALGKSGSL
ncbi:MAG: hypothetical protein GYA21_10905 [Myxococcales bacterium]|nr:hypothetical protein [Myxococcales bacterium]